ncbi:pilin [Micromonospora soli]|uniref:pilin n=1 Tax=Micromonospora sp. NBRC 110009 TaxID=3061627 RepID=UPI0026712F23|nr:pilin [Micromonospora sp. NBRC 110009]WKT97619.1 pilin [Micromonospora sp. NBRC 110009]
MYRIRARLRALTTVHVLRRLVTVAVATVVVVATPAVAHADPGAPAIVAVNSLPVVVANLRAWLIGILAALATLFLVLAGVYWATAGGDPAQVERAKGALKNALVGYGLAILAPVLLQVVQGIVGG